MTLVFKIKSYILLLMINQIFYQKVPKEGKTNVFKGESLTNRGMKIVGVQSIDLVSYEHPKRFYSKLFEPIEIDNIHENRDIFLNFIGNKFKIKNFVKKWGFLNRYRIENFSDVGSGFFKLLSLSIQDKKEVNKNPKIFEVKFKDELNNNLSYEFFYEYIYEWELERNYLFNLVHVINILHSNNFDDFFNLITNKFSKQNEDVYLIDLDIDKNLNFLTFKNYSESLTMINNLKMEIFKNENEKNFYVNDISRKIEDFKIFIGENKTTLNEYSKENYISNEVGAEPDFDNDVLELDYSDSFEEDKKTTKYTINKSNLRKLLLKFVTDSINSFTNIEISFRTDKKTGEPTQKMLVNNLRTLLGIAVFNFFKSHNPLLICKNCADYFTITMQGGNKNQLFCSNKCRHAMTYKNEQVLKKIFEKNGYFILNQPQITNKLKNIFVNQEYQPDSPLRNYKVTDFVAFQHVTKLDDALNIITGNSLKFDDFILFIEHVADLKKFHPDKIIKFLDYYSSRYPRKCTFCISDSEEFIYLFKDKKVDLIATDNIVEKNQLDFLFSNKDKIKSINNKSIEVYKLLYLSNG